MTPFQRRHYHARLWPAACVAQGWDKKDENKRREVTQEATGSASTSSLNQGQLTLLFNRLKWLAEPANFDAAYADANPEIVLEEDKRARIIWRIEQTTAKAGLKDEWLTQIAAAKCEANVVKSWRQLPTMELLKLSMTVESRTTEMAKARRLKNTPPEKPVQETCTDDAEGIDMPF
jgi:hypothetical protein